MLPLPLKVLQLREESEMVGAESGGRVQGEILCEVGAIQDD